MDEKVIKIIKEVYPKMTDKEKLAFGIAFVPIDLLKKN